MNDILIHLWLGFMLVLAGGVWYGIRHFGRKLSIARGVCK
ncbi:hypothetical protein PS928_00507 [Pseudomonas fluorescens]|uniref:Uncharacterized protein n=1 Tax=Pseudomonas fluorescens TaxID=294 RepID=A0A5E7RY14_PSEFL|nr:hypothetical protein PS928_00507 [Pseudomonas fluorescens]